MVLNLLRVEEINPEYMLEKSFYQFQHYRALPGVVESKPSYSPCPPLQTSFSDGWLVLPAEIKKYEDQYHTIEIPNQESVVTYFKIRQQLAKLGKEIQEFIHRPKYCLPFLQPGRLVKVEPLALPSPAPSSRRPLLTFSAPLLFFCTAGEERRRRLRLGGRCELQQEDQREGQRAVGTKRGRAR